MLGWLKVDLKSGVTNKEIKGVINRIREKYDPSIEWRVIRGELYIRI